MFKTKKFLKGFGAVCFWILIWQIAAMAANKDLLIAIPTPITTIKALVEGLKTAEFYSAVGFSVLRISIGFGLALLTGTLFALLSNAVLAVDTLFSPILKIIRAIPVASFIILVFLWMSREYVPSFIAFLTVLPIVWKNVSDGIAATDKSLIEMARIMGMGKLNVLKSIMLPAAKPFIQNAVSTGLGFAFKSGVAAEIICRTQNSLGDMLYSGKASVNYDEVFAVTAVVVLLSVVLEHGVVMLFKGRQIK